MVGALIIMSMFILYLFTTKNKLIRVVSLPLKIILVGAGFLMMLFFIEIIKPRTKLRLSEDNTK